MARVSHDDEFVNLPSLLTPGEMAILLRTSRKAIYAAESRGQLPGATRVGRRLLFRREAVVTWLNESRAPSPTENQ